MWWERSGRLPGRTESSQKRLLLLRFRWISFEKVFLPLDLVNIQSLQVAKQEEKRLIIVLEGAHLESCKTGKEFSLLNIDEHRGLLSRWLCGFCPVLLMTSSLLNLKHPAYGWFIGTGESSQAPGQISPTSPCLCSLTLLWTGLDFFRLLIVSKNLDHQPFGVFITGVH